MTHSRSYSTDVEGGRQVQLRFTIHGRFGGAFYLEFVADRARWLAIRGWARLAATDRIELLAAGPEALVGALEMACTLGPLDALVDGVEVRDDDGDAGSDFELR